MGISILHFFVGFPLADCTFLAMMPEQLVNWVLVCRRYACVEMVEGLVSIFALIRDPTK
jgi:hypothetical protein